MLVCVREFRTTMIDEIRGPMPIGRRLFHKPIPATGETNMNIARAIEQEMKYIADSEDGSRQFRKGYLRALEIVTEFLDSQKPDSVVPRVPNAAVGRLLSVVEERPEDVHPQLAATAIDDKESLDLPAVNPLEAKVLQIALGVIRSGTDYGDFLNAWLHDYGQRVLSHDPPDPLLPEISTEEELALRIQDAPFYIH
jgi:hypothetical protein